MAEPSIQWTVSTLQKRILHTYAWLILFRKFKRFLNISKSLFTCSMYHWKSADAGIFTWIAMLEQSPFCAFHSSSIHAFKFAYCFIDPILNKCGHWSVRYIVFEIPMTGVQFYPFIFFEWSLCLNRRIPFRLIQTVRLQLCFISTSVISQYPQTAELGHKERYFAMKNDWRHSECCKFVQEISFSSVLRRKKLPN